MISFNSFAEKMRGWNSYKRSLTSQEEQSSECDERDSDERDSNTETNLFGSYTSHQHTGQPRILGVLQPSAVDTPFHTPRHHTRKQ